MGNNRWHSILPATTPNGRIKSRAPRLQCPVHAAL
jgi:hypothetical protein